MRAPGLLLATSICLSATACAHRPGVRVERYPLVDAPAQVAPREAFPVQVSLELRSLAGGGTEITGGDVTARGQLRMTLPEGSSWPIDVVIAAPGLEVLVARQQVVLTPDGSSSRATFTLRAGARPGRHDVWVTFWHGGRFLGRARRAVEVRERRDEPTSRPRTLPLPPPPIASAPRPPPPPPTTASAPRPEPPAAVPGDVVPAAALPRAAAPEAAAPRPGAATPSSVTAQPPVQPVSFGTTDRVADLTIWILSGRNPADPAEATLLVSGPDLLPVMTEYRMDPGLPAWLADRYARLAARAGARSADVDPAAAEEERASAIELARSIGRTLWDRHVPAAAREAFAKAHARVKRPLSVEIYTSNPLLPWELLSYRSEDGAWHDFLGIAGAVARWHVDENARLLARPPSELPLRSLVAIAPRYQGSQALENATTDLKAPRSAVSARIREVRGRRADLRVAFDDPGEISVVHFAGHGAVRPPATEGGAPRFVLALEDGELEASEWVGFVPQRGDHPFVFLNACGLGKEERVAGSVEGWAGAVLETGASGYLGGLWPLGDAAASDFAQRFYAAVLEGQPAAVAVAKARAAFLETGDPTYLAYVYYGDFDLRIDAR